MAIKRRVDGCSDSVSSPPLKTESAPTGLLHRIRAVREQQGISLRSAARQMDIDIRQARLEEEGTTDLRLSDLYRWQKILDVPLGELLAEADFSLSQPLKERAQLLRLMRTTVSILEQSRSKSVKRLAQASIDQLTEMMPELKLVGGWHAVGQRRSQEEYGQAASRQFPHDVMSRIQSEV